MCQQESTLAITINAEICDKEGLCVLTCIENIFEQSDRKTLPTIVHPEACFSCGQCLAICPSDAISHSGLEALENFPLIKSSRIKIEPERLLGFLRARRSIRTYNQKHPVLRETIEEIIDAARYAPTGSNAQSLEHVVITDRKTMDRLVALGVGLFQEKVTSFQIGLWITQTSPFENGLSESSCFFVKLAIFGAFSFF